MTRQSYKDLRVWQRAIKLAGEVHRLTGDFPRLESFGLTRRMRKAAVSIPVEIAEGFERLSGVECLRPSSAPGTRQAYWLRTRQEPKTSFRTSTFQ